PEILIELVSETANYQDHLDQDAYAIGGPPFSIGFEAALIFFVGHTVLSGTAGPDFWSEYFSRFAVTARINQGLRTLRLASRQSPSEAADRPTQPVHRFIPLLPLPHPHRLELKY